MPPPLDRSQPPLLKTKLCVPQRRADLVARPRLLQLLAEGSARTLTLICAPAGYGKTTLLTDWLATLAADQEDLSVCWLSLDAGDNDPNLFVSYLIRALGSGHPQLAAAMQDLLESFPLPPLPTFLNVLINILHDFNRPVCLVLDDYQYITHRGINEGVAYVLDHLPATTHVIIAARSDPPLPVARLRARNQLVEIRADDLRFTAEEAADFLTQVMRLPLSPGDIAALETRTEGWIAGLQMAAVAMRGQARPGVPAESRSLSAFIERFSGSHRYILDYMAEETINHLPEDVQRFLAWTSLLARFCAPLCDALLADARISSAEMIAYLDRANLFLIVLEREAAKDSAAGSGAMGDPVWYRYPWYRYHHLFTDLLRARLKQSQPEVIPLLHRRAADWYEQHGFISDAVEHHLTAGAYEQAAELIERYGPAHWSQSDTTVIMQVAQLPPAVLSAHPRLGLYQVWILISGGHTPEALPLLHELKARVSADSAAEAAWMSACADLLLAYVAKPAEGQSLPNLPDLQALETMPAEDGGLHNIVDFLAAMILGRRGEADRPAEILIRCVQRDIAAGGTTAIPLVIPFLARARLMQGRLREAVDLCQQHLRPMAKRGTRYYYLAGSLNIVLGEALKEWNALDEAEAQIRAGIKANEPWQNVAVDSLGYSALARVQEARGDLAGALDTLQTLETMFVERTRPPDWEAELRSLRVRLWLSGGELERALDWANQYPLKQPLDLHQELDQLTVARVRLAAGDYAAAQAALEALNQVPGIDRRVNRMLKVNLLLACVLAGRGQNDQALQTLEACLDLAEPEGAIRVFLDNGQPMADLLRRCLAAPAPRHADYVQKILAAFAGSDQAASRPLAAPAPAQASLSALATAQAGLVEPLTPRELEVLRLMATGCTNRQIAETLVNSEGTIKYHVHSILAKLEVHSRTAALVKAKALGLV